MLRSSFLSFLLSPAIFLPKMVDMLLPMLMLLQLLGVLLQCSTFHTRYEGLLHDCNAMRAGYLFQQDKHYDVSHDTGDKVQAHF